MLYCTRCGQSVQLLLLRSTSRVSSLNVGAIIEYFSAKVCSERVCILCSIMMNNLSTPWLLSCKATSCLLSSTFITNLRSVHPERLNVDQTCADAAGGWICSSVSLSFMLFFLLFAPFVHICYKRSNTGIFDIVLRTLNTVTKKLQHIQPATHTGAFTYYTWDTFNLKMVCTQVERHVSWKRCEQCAMGYKVLF